MADADLLRMLGSGAAIEALLTEQGWDRGRFEAWWQERLEERLPAPDGVLPAGVTAGAEGQFRDDRGVPHCFADSDEDLFLAYGLAMAQDRLFQLDVRRRKGHGTLAALIGPAGLADDRIAHTIGFGALAAAETERLDDETRRLYDRFAEGIELAVAAMGDRLPIEYALLDAGWEPWSALDAIACTTAWRWQFTGRPHVIAGPELLKRALGDDELVAAILLADREADASSLPPDTPYPPGPPNDAAATRSGSPASLVDASGSNNWVIAGSRSSSGRPLLASDPHMPFEWASAFFDVGLHGGSFNAVGAGLVGQPGLLGRDRDVAFGITNNICSLRDLYAERPVAGADGSYEFDGAAEPAERSSVAIEVRGAEPETLEVARTRRGPIIDAILPAPARGTGPVSMRWLGSEACAWPAALLRLARSTSVRDARAALDGWLVPSFAFVLADRAGSIGYVTTGRIPLRSRPSRTYRPGWDPDDDWTGLVPHEGMPAAFDPAQGWLGSANNRPAPDDYPWPLSGTWSEGYRLRRIGQLIEEAPAGGADRTTLRDMHADVRSTRAEAVLPDLLALLRPPDGERERVALDLLEHWDRRATADSAATAVYEVFIHRWAQAVLAEHVDDRDLADHLANWGMGFAVELLARDDDRWFAPGRRAELARATFAAALDEIAARLGDDMSAWRWGAIHRRALPHALSGIGDLAELLDKPTLEVGGDMATLDNSGFEAARPAAGSAGDATGWEASSGAGYRLEVDLGEEPAAIWSITAESQTALPGSPHYDDQMDDFMADRTRRLPLDRAEVEAMARGRLRLVPDSGDGVAGTSGTAGS